MLELFKIAAFISVLIYASCIDIKTKTVPTKVHILLFITGLLGVNLLSFLGLIATFIPLFIAALVTNIGGGDVKFAAMCGFVLQGTNGLLSILLGLILALVLVPIIHKLQHKPTNTPFALVPYLSAGCVIMALKGMF